MKKNKNKNKIYKIIMIIFSIILIICIVKIVLWYKDVTTSNEIKDKTTQIAEIKEVEDNEQTKKVNPPKDKFDPYWDYIKMPLISVNFQKLIKENKDTVGWIKVENTNINYPVVQTSNNKYYLTHGFDKNYNEAGWIYMDYRNNPTSFSKNTVIYGHSMKNQSMFATLKRAIRKDWYQNKNNHIIKFSTPTENTLWQVFSTYKIKSESYYIQTHFTNTKQYQTWLNKIAKRSVFDYKTSVTTKDKILTLSSCYDINGNRVAVHAKLIKVEKR